MYLQESRLLRDLFYKKKIDIIYFFFLLTFSIFINQYYGYIGVYPIDTFFHYDSGYRVLNGYFPTKDYWINSGFLIDLIQAAFFKIFGVSFFSYVLHASIFNFIIVIATFFTLRKFELNNHFSFFYSLLMGFIAYPISGTPFVDLHSMILSLLALFSFILSLKTRSNIYWFFTPIFLCLAFLCKQTPAAYFGIIIATFSLIYFINYFNAKNFIFFILGGLTIILLFYIFCLINTISLYSFYNQLILFPSTIGESRFKNFLFPLEFNRLILRYKLIHLSQFILIFVIVKKIFKRLNYFTSIEFIILSSIVISSFSLIAHQLLTLNQKFIFFIIPILLGFSHIYYKKNFTRNSIIVYILIFFGLGSTFYYKFSYIDNRKFMELEKVDLNKSIDGSMLSESLNNLKWITPIFPNNPNKEIKLLKDTIEVIKNEKRKIMLVTHYQFIASILDDYVYSLNRSYWAGLSFPSLDSKIFDLYKSFFLNQITSNNIEVIYVIKPVDKNIYLSLLEKNCFQTKKVNEILYTYLIVNCKT
tara:strand:+ start:814 stop:2403 length:1590 start_codon:yes stop_codon:yes gene_type:complete